MNLQNIGNNIKTLRLAKNMTQSQLAEKAQISTVHISHIETGTVAMSLDSLINIANSLETTPNNILLGEYSLTTKSTTTIVDRYIQSLTSDEKRLIIEFSKLLGDIKPNRN